MSLLYSRYLETPQGTSKAHQDQGTLIRKCFTGYLDKSHEMIKVIKVPQESDIQVP